MSVEANPSRGCCGVLAPCCPDDEIPETLTATFQDLSNCACMDGVEVSIQHEISALGAHQWVGDLPAMCGHNACSRGLRFTCGEGGAGVSINCNCGFFFRTVFQSSFSCNPVQWVGSASYAECCGTGTFGVTITE
jgi:hypothetical protein